MAEARMALCRSRADRILAASRSQSRVEPSISVKRKVTVPEGGAMGMIGVEDRATMRVQFTKQHRQDGEHPGSDQACAYRAARAKGTRAALRRHRPHRAI